MDVTVHIFDAADPDEKNSFPIYVASGLIPRVGEGVHYYVDYPHWIENPERFEEGEPREITGTVDRVEVEFRVMRSQGSGGRCVSSASVYLRDYEATLP